MGKLSFASVLFLPISSALFYPPNPKATSTLSLATSIRTAPYIFLLLFLKVTAIKTEGSATPKTPGKSKRPHCFPAGTRALTRFLISKF
ncbi:hypothetical protein V6Z12_D07G076200 [Gossypium hirsutum]